MVWGFFSERNWVTRLKSDIFFRRMLSTFAAINQTGFQNLFGLRRVYPHPMYIFQSSRLGIRPLRLDDIEPFHEMQSNLQVMQYTTGRGQSREENQQSLEDCILKYSAPENDFWIWAIERKADAAFVGTVALLVNEDGEDEIGFRLLEKYWGNGYGQEAAEALFKYAFESKAISKLVAYVFADNVGSVKILERAGFVLIKEFWNEESQMMDRLYHLTPSFLA